MDILLSRHVGTIRSVVCNYHGNIIYMAAVGCSRAKYCTQKMGES